MVSDLRSIIRAAQGRQGQPLCHGDGWTHIAVELRERTARGLRQLQTQARQQGAYGSGHTGPSVGDVCHTSRRARARAGAQAVRGRTAGHGPHGATGLGADQGYTGETASKAAQSNGIDLQIVKLPEAKKGLVLLPRRWVVERSFS